MEELTDFGSIQELIGSMTGNHALSFSQLVAQLQEGDFSGLKDTVVNMLSDWLTDGGLLPLSDFAGILLLVLLFALLRAMGQAFENKSITTFSGIVIHLLLITQLAILFRGFQEQTKMYLENEITFSSTLFPVLAVASAASGEGLSAAGIYASAISISSLVSRLYLYILLPGVSIFLVVSLLNSIMPESLFSGLTGLLKKGLGLLMKGSFAAVTGLQVIQMMVLPRADSVRQQTILKTAALIPGVGSVTDTAATVMWESGSLLKGSIGAAGMVCVLLICVFPALRIALVSALYHGMAAVMMPVADKNICGCLSSFAESLEYLVRITCVCAVILLMMVAVAAW